MQKGNKYAQGGDTHASADELLNNWQWIKSDEPNKLHSAQVLANSRVKGGGEVVDGFFSSVEHSTLVGEPLTSSSTFILVV